MRKKTGGRKAGTPNKNTMDLFAKCEAMGIDVFEEMLKVIHDSDTKPQRRDWMLDRVSQYLYPKRKQIEVDSADEGFTIIVKDYTSKS